MRRRHWFWLSFWVVLLWGVWVSASPRFDLQLSAAAPSLLEPVRRIEVTQTDTKVTITIDAPTVAWVLEQHQNGHYILDLPYGLITESTVIMAIDPPGRVEWGNADETTGRLMISPAPEQVEIKLQHNWQDQLAIDPYEDIDRVLRLPPQEAIAPVLAVPPRSAFLTIDDGPWPDSTVPLVESLDQLGIPATFFLIGAHVDNYPELAKTIHDHHYAIANHTYTHDFERLYSDDELFYAEIDHTQQVLADLDLQPQTIIRPPGGFPLSNNLNYSLAQAGYSVLYWNISPEDAYADQTPAALLERVQSQLDMLRDSDLPLVVLLHDRWPHTVAALPQIVHMIQAAGYQFLPLPS